MNRLIICWMALLLVTALHLPCAIAATTLPSTLSSFILTPPAPATPRINGPRIFGVRPGHPLLYTIPVTGDTPIRFDAENLPDGLTLDPSSGQISGSVATPGTYVVTLRSSNAEGASNSALSIVVGNQICLTPPMGWNTYYPFRLNVSDGLVRGQAAAMVSSGLTKHGFSYISIDEGWETKPGATDPNLAGPVRDESGVIRPNKKFPDMAALCRDIHAMGLKVGIYSSPGPLCCGGSVGSYQHEYQDVRTFADWGVDYVKYDWCSYAKIAQEQRIIEYARLLPASAEQIKELLIAQGELDAIRPHPADYAARSSALTARLATLCAGMDPAKKRAADVAIASAPYAQFARSLAKVNRDMVYSFCQYGMDNVWEWGADAGGNLWRTHRDIIDDWQRVCSIGFGEAGTENCAGPGHWNDPDILQVGVEARGIPSRLTPDEQYAQVSLWCLLSAPLLIGGDLTKLDDFTLNLLTNDEVLAVDQDELGNQASRIRQNGMTEVWAKKMKDGSRALGLFNRGPVPQAVGVNWADLHLTGAQRIRDLWRQKELGIEASQFSATVPAHGVVLISVRSANQ